MHHSHISRFWLCCCLVLFTASCLNAAPTDPALVGTWETTAVLDGRQWKFTYEITESEDYRFTSVTTDGKVWAQNGEWSVKSRRGFDDRGTYKFSGLDSVLITGKRGTANWKRVSTGDYTSGSKVEKELLGTWTTQAPIDGKEWAFTWVLKETGRYKLTGVTDDGSLIAHDGQWKSVSVSGKTEEGQYTFLDPNAMSMTGPKGTGMWSRAGQTPNQQVIAQADRKRKKPQHNVTREKRQPKCAASMDEKGEDGYPAPLLGQAVEDVRFTNSNLPNGLQVSTDRPVVQTWGGPRKDGQCGRGIYHFKGPNVTARVYYYIYNTQADTKARVKKVFETGLDDGFYTENFSLTPVSNLNVSEKGQTVMTCWHPETLVELAPVRLACLDLQPVYSIVTAVRGDFTTGTSPDVAANELNALRAHAKKLIALSVLRVVEE